MLYGSNASALLPEMERGRPLVVGSPLGEEVDWSERKRWIAGLSDPFITLHLFL